MRFVIFLFASLILVTPAAAQGYERGIAAIQRGDHMAAFSEWLPLAEAGDMRAQAGVGLPHRTGGAGIEQDEARSAYWFEKSAEQGFVISQRLIGAFYAQGRGVEKDPVAARKWFLAAAERGDGFAQYGLALLLYRGEGGPVDSVGALEWMSQAADRLPPGQMRNRARSIRERGIEIIDEILKEHR